MTFSSYGHYQSPHCTLLYFLLMLVFNTYGNKASLSWLIILTSHTHLQYSFITEISHVKSSLSFCYSNWLRVFIGDRLWDKYAKYGPFLSIIEIVTSYLPLSLPWWLYFSVKEKLLSGQIWKDSSTRAVKKFASFSFKIVLNGICILF